MNYWNRIIEALSPRITPVGLEIQDGNLALAVADINKETLEVKHYLSQPMHADAIVNGKLVKPELFREAVEKLLSSLPIPKDRITFNLSLPPKFFYSDIIYFPSMSEEALESAVKLKLETILPWKLEESHIVWEVTDRTAGRIAIFVTAAKKSEILSYLQIFRELNVRVWFMETHLLSLARFLKLLHDLKEFIFINVDRDGIEVLAMHNRKMIFRSVDEPLEGERLEEVLRKQIIITLSYVNQNLGFHPSKILIMDRFGLLEAAKKDLHPESDWPEVSFLGESWRQEKLIAMGASIFRKQLHSEVLNMLPAGEGRYEEELLMESIHFWLKTAEAVFITISLILLGVLGIFRLRINYWQEAAKIRAIASEQLALYSESVQKAAEFNKIVGELEKASDLRLTILPFVREIIEILGEHQAVMERLTKRDEGSPFLAVVRVPSRAKALELKKALQDSTRFSKVEIPPRDMAPERDLVLNITLFPK